MISPAISQSLLPSLRETQVSDRLSTLQRRFLFSASRQEAADVVPAGVKEGHGPTSFLDRPWSLFYVVKSPNEGFKDLERN